MNEAIVKAIEGGYIKGEIEVNNDGVWLSNADKTLHQSDILLDPTFWQALGKAMGWTKVHEFGCYDGTVGGLCDCVPQIGWQYHWHSLIGHLASGGDVDSFFGNLFL